MRTMEEANVTLEPQPKEAQLLTGADAGTVVAASTPQRPHGTAADYKLHASTGLTVRDLVEELEYLTFPSLAQRSRAQQLREPLFSVVVTKGRLPVGLILAQGAEDRQVAEIVSLYVRRDHRGRGLSHQLFAGIQTLLCRHGFSQVQLAYRADWPARPLIERCLRRFGWSAPATRLGLGKFNLSAVAEAWQASPIARVTLPKEFEILAWNELQQADLQSLQHDQTGDYPAELAPIQEPERIESLNSLVLRTEGRVVGWLVTHRLDEQTIQYTRLHIAPPYQTLGRGLTLLTAAVARQIESGVPFGVFQVRADNPRMQQLVTRRLRPFLSTWTESLGSTKHLRPSSLNTKGNQAL